MFEFLKRWKRKSRPAPSAPAFDDSGGFWIDAQSADQATVAARQISNQIREDITVRDEAGRIVAVIKPQRRKAGFEL